MTIKGVGAAPFAQTSKVRQGSGAGKTRETKPVDFRRTHDTYESSGKSLPGPELLRRLESASIGTAGLDGAFPEKLSAELQDASPEAREIASLMDENDAGLYMRLTSGMSVEELAEHFGKIGRRIDAADIPDHERAELEAGLHRYTTFVCGQAQRESAMREVLRKRAEETLERVKNGDTAVERRTVEEEAESLRREVDGLIVSTCRIDLDAMREKVARVRAGAEPVVTDSGRETEGQV